MTSIFIAKLVGPLLLVAGLATAFNPGLLRQVGQEFLDSAALLFTAGIAALLLGLSVVATHNIWVAGWPVIITIIGWIAVVAGVVRILFPGTARAFGRKMLANTGLLRTIAGIDIILGAFLMFQGYA